MAFCHKNLIAGAIDYWRSREICSWNGKHCQQPPSCCGRCWCYRRIKKYINDYVNSFFRQMLYSVMFEMIIQIILCDHITDINLNYTIKVWVIYYYLNLSTSGDTPYSIPVERLSLWCHTIQRPNTHKWHHLPYYLHTPFIK